jgi:hypothetical protein
LGDANRYYVAEHEGHTIEVEIRPASVLHLTRIAALFIDNRRVEEVHYGPGWFSLRGWLKGDSKPVVVRVRDGLLLSQKVVLEADGIECPMKRVY